MTRLAILALAGLGLSAAHAETAADLSARVSAEVKVLGQTAQMTIMSADGWVCAGTVDMPATSTKKKSGERNTVHPETVRLTCTDGSRATARASRDEDRREWRIAFTHKDYGRADLRVREN